MEYRVWSIEYGAGKRAEILRGELVARRASARRGRGGILRMTGEEGGHPPLITGGGP